MKKTAIWIIPLTLLLVLGGAVPLMADVCNQCRPGPIRGQFDGPGTLPCIPSAPTCPPFPK